MQKDDVLGKLKSFFVKEALDGEEEGLDASTPLLELGVIDSFTIPLLLQFVKEQFGVELPNSELNVKNLKDLDALTSLVLRTSSSSSPPA